MIGIKQNKLSQDTPNNSPNMTENRLITVSIINTHLIISFCLFMNDSNQLLGFIWESPFL